MPTAGDDRGTGPERAWHRAPVAGTTITLDADESVHLIRARRVAVGDAVVCFDGVGANVRGTLIQANPKAATVALEAPYPARDPVVRLCVAASVPEPARADAMVTELAALGVDTYVPLICARTPHKRDALVARRAARWTRAAREAAKVNGCAHVLRVAQPESFNASLPRGGWILDPDPAVPPLAHAWKPGSADAHNTVLRVGPEGGFTDEERSAASELDIRAARLGSPVLRVGLAAVVAAACILLQEPPS